MAILDQTWRDHLAALQDAGRLRELRPLQGGNAASLIRNGAKLVNFSSNDYLGLSSQPAIIQRGIDFAREWGAGSRSSRLVCGEIQPFRLVEEKLAAAKGTEAALILASGYQANATILPALLDRSILGAEPLVFADKLNHSSLHHGITLAGCRQIRFRHNDLDHLESLLRDRQSEKAARFIVTESVFSMDGDRADLFALVSLAERHGAFLYIDEAHATGVLGEKGFGLSEGLAQRIGLVMGTFSKGLGGFGAYAACSAALRDYLINRCTGLIYSTALPPFALGAMDAALDLVPGMIKERQNLHDLAEMLRTGLRQRGIDFGPSSTQIVPAILGEESRALEVSRRLERMGFVGVAIRPPTVPPRSSRIRFSVSALHSDVEIADLLGALDECLPS